MNPSSEQIEKWAEDMGDGWTRIPTSSWPDLLWCLREAEKVEKKLELSKIDECDAIAGEEVANQNLERAKTILQMIGSIAESPGPNPNVALADIGAHVRAFDRVTAGGSE